MNTIHWHKFGTEEFPVPIMDAVTRQIRWLASEEDAIYIPTMREDSKEAIYGRLIRQVVTDPTLMPDMTEILIRMDETRTPKTSKSYGYTAMGAPGNGKTYLMKAIGELVHPRGAFILDCNGLNEEESKKLYQETTLSVNQVKKLRKIDAKIRMGNIDEAQAFSQNTIAFMKKMFGNDIVTQEIRDGRRITAVDWGSIELKSEDIEEILDRVMEMENIPYEKDGGSLGFVVSNGNLLRALADPNSPDYGRIVIRDEVNRAPKVDAWLRIEAFFSEPGTGSLTLPGQDDKEYTIQYSQIPATFMFLGTANHATEDMGISAKELTKPMISRQGMGIDIRLIADPEKADYLSRTLKHLTGVPAYHVYMMDPETFDKNPEMLAETLMYFRTVGLTPEEKKKIPQDELFNIRHIDRTIKVATKYGALLAETENIILTASKDDALPERYTSYLSNQAVVDLRYVFKLHQHSEIDTPRGKSGASTFAKLGRASKEVSPEEIAWEMNKRIAKREKNKLLVRGTRLENELAVKLNQMIRPDSLKGMLKDSENIEEDIQKIDGYWKALLQTAKGLNFEFATYIGEDSVAKLYNARPEDFPSVELEEIKEVLIASIREEYKDDLKGQRIMADDVFDDTTLLEATQLLAKEDEYHRIFVPNYDIETTYDKPLKEVYIKPSHEESVEIDRENLINTNQFADSFIIKGMRNHNMKKYAKELSPEFEKQLYGDEVSKEIALGKNKYFITTCVLVNDEENKKIGLAAIIYNKSNQNAMILADFDVSEEDKMKLKKSGVFFVNLNEVNESGDYNLIDNYLSQQTAPCGEVSNAQIISALVMRIDPALGDSSNADARDFCVYFQNQAEEDKSMIDAIQLTNIDFEKDVPINVAMNKAKRGR